MLKDIIVTIAEPLSHIFNRSLISGKFPNSLKICRVVPIFKSGDDLLCDNYRPISLVKSLSKILEKIVADKLDNHLIHNDLLYTHQYGFQKNIATEHNMIHVVNDISTALNENMYCIGVFFDLKKGF